MVDVVATFISSYIFPTWLISSPNAATAAALPLMPSLRRLRVACAQGVRLVGGIPRQLMGQAPGLQAFVMAGCGVQDTLPTGEHAGFLGCWGGLYF